MTGTIDSLFRGRSVFVTGHTGFKGSWLSLWLGELGARVHGYSDGIPTRPSAFEMLGIAQSLAGDARGDIADPGAVAAAVARASPSVIFHLAAQPIVREGFRSPYATFAANVMGTVAVLEAARQTASVEAVVVVTSDKVYDNTGSPWGFRETDPLGGHEPYGASKAAAEIVAMAYRSAGFHAAARSPNRPAIATARAGNVIGGGDWAADRLIPDLVRAIAEGRDQPIRQPRSTRPWQHVLEPLGGYLCLAAALLDAARPPPAAVNFGPSDPVVPDVETIATAFLDILKPPRTRLLIDEAGAAGEARTLHVDSSLALGALSWRSCWSVAQAVAETANWYRAYLEGGNDLRGLAIEQLAAYRRASPVTSLKP
ncbi:MAG: CDP-glucose 4,6-dehydratase [Rhizobiaceae bacterium]|nr:CDP-glucose 4,6-dehydratase [Rhizobiaceae bacterium]